jgi:EF hand domain-containing protein
MRRSQLVLLSVLVTVGASGRANAQAVIVSATAPAGASSNEVVARLLSFDLNQDGKVEKNELAERMRQVVARGDVDGDGALDGSELHALATTLPPRTQVFEQRFRYTFADQTGLSSRLHIERSLDDLRLEPSTKERALAVVHTYVEAVEETASADLLTWLKVVLPRDQLLEISETLSLQRRRTAGKSGLNSSQLLERIGEFKIGPIERRMAVAEVGVYEDRLRLRDVERAELMDQLKNILTDEERENFRAALARRPLASVGVVM